jgi:hypothetical protein
MKNLKIHVKNEKESAEAQELFFKLGGSWDISCKNIQYTKQPYLYLNNSSVIQHGSIENIFQRNGNQEVTLSVLREILKAKEKYDNHVTDAVNYGFVDIEQKNKECENIMEKENNFLKEKPKHPKVWAWDNYINEAFETYLIAEFEEMQNNYNYLIVHNVDIESFEHKEVFEIDYAKNISYTDPRINEEVEEIAKIISSEYVNNQQLDWSLISAKKIYETFIKNK